MTAPPPERRRSLLPWAIAAVFAVALAAALIVPRLGGDSAEAQPVATRAASVPPKTLSVRGTLKLGPGDFIWDDGTGAALTGPSCAGDGGFDDIAVGASVTVTDGSGTVVALGKVDTSNPTDFDSDTTSAGGQRARGCNFTFTVTGVPPGKGFYGVEVSHRGAVKVAEADLADSINLTLG